MIVRKENGKEEVKVLAYFRTDEEKKIAIKKIMEKRKSFVIYKLLPKKEKIQANKRFLKYLRLNPHKRKKFNKKWRDKNVEKIRELTKKYILKYPEKQKARNWSKYHRKEILEVKGEKCEECNSVENLEIHHKKYTNNLEDLQILCMKCHKKLDRKYSDEELGIGG